MNTTVVVAAIGIVIAVSVLFLIAKLLKSEKPPCEFRTIEFKPGTTEKGDYAVFAEPELLDKVQECAVVLFSNQTKNKITIEFADENLLFKDVTKFELEPVESEDHYSKGLPVAFELDSDTPDKVFKYKVIPDGPPPKEQSPRIRVGPRPAAEM